MDKRTILFVVSLSLTLFVVNIFFSIQDRERNKEWYEQQRLIREEQQQEELLVEKTAPPEPETETTPVLTKQDAEEQFYVLENDYQQLVFSTRGGALAEINLPFRGITSEQSIVREIALDREIAEEYPVNGFFPAHRYFTPGETSTGPFVEHEEGMLGGYYPLLRRDLIDTTTGERRSLPPQNYAVNIVSEYPELARMNYRVVSFEKNRIVFEAVQTHRRIVKTYTLEQNDAAPYCLDVEIKIDGDSRGLWLTSGVPEVEFMSGSSVPSMKFRMTRNQKVDVEKIKLPKDAITASSVYPDWLCNSNGFLGLVLDPLTKIDAGYRAQRVGGEVVPSRFVEVDKKNQRYQAEKLPGYMMSLPLLSKGGTMKFRMFAGPFAEEVLKKVDARYSDTTTGYTPDYISCITFHGWFSFISEPFARFLFVLMKLFHRMTHSWAIAIILLTVTLRLMLYPLNAWSMKSMRRMQQIGPEVTVIQQKHKKDPKKAQLEIMTLYRSRGVNPLSGCFPMLIQMPFLIGMFDLLRSTFELRGVSFIPGWIDNLTAPDVLFSWAAPIPFIGRELHLLPLLLGGVMYLQQKVMSTLPKDKSLWTDQQKQQKTMGMVMTMVFMVMFYHFASGLNLYWLSSMLLGILQQWVINRQLDRSLPKEPTTTVTAQKRRARSTG